MEENLLIMIVMLLSVLIMFISHYILLIKPELIRRKLKKQGIEGPRPAPVVGNVAEMKRIVSDFQHKMAQNKKPSLLDSPLTLFQYFKHWTTQYGKIFMYMRGRVPVLCVTDLGLVKEINLFKSLDIGKPAYLQKDVGPLLGKGIMTSNGPIWSHDRKILAPQFYMNNMKGMVRFTIESANTLVKSWESLVELNGGTADIVVDDHVRIFTATVISKVVFGSDYHKGLLLFPKCRTLLKAMDSPATLKGIPFSQYLPTSKKRAVWKLEKEIHSMIINIAKERNNGSNKNGDILQVLMNDVLQNGELGSSSSAHNSIVDNCKDIYIPGVEAIGISAIWGLMLLASHPEWQARIRAEFREICNDDDYLDIDKLEKMKLLNMVVQEVLRLYPPSPFVNREALKDLKLGNISIPKGVNIVVWMIGLQRDPEIWGPDADEFKPERFANGVSGACKYPQTFIPFGLGARICPGKYLSIMELKVLFAVIISNFSLSISPNYRHSPQYGMLLEPAYGLNLLIHKII